MLVDELPTTLTNHGELIVEGEQSKVVHYKLRYIIIPSSLRVPAFVSVHVELILIFFSLCC